MKLTKRLVAVALAILMIFGSFSVALTASAAEGGTSLGITTKFFRSIKGVWTVTDKVVEGEEVKLGVFLDTDYYSGDGSILLYYSNEFFEESFDQYEQTLTVGDYYGKGTAYDIGGNFCIGSDSQAGTISQAMVNGGKVTQSYASTHEPVYITYKYGQSAKPQMFDDNELFCEIPLTVKKTPASTQGLAEALESTIASSSFQRGKINVPKTTADGHPGSASPMWTWDASPKFEEEPVELFKDFASISFDTAGGKFSLKATSTVYVTTLYAEGDAGEAVDQLVTSVADGGLIIDALPTPTRDGYSFKGWKVKGTDDSTATEVTVYPSDNTDYEAVWEKEEVTGNGLKFRTEIYRLDEKTGEWVYTEKVKPGEQVKARLFIDTEYNAGNGEILFVYDGDFFEDDYDYDSPVAADTNNSATSSVKQYGITGTVNKLSSDNRTLNDMIDNGYLTKEFIKNHPVIVSTYSFPSGRDCQVISDDEWFIQFDLTVKENAVGEGDFYVYADTVCTTEDGPGYWAYTTVGKQSDTSTKAADADNMTMWDADVDIESHPVSIYNTITFSANGGEFAADDKNTFVIEGTVGEAVDYSVIPEVSRDGWTFIGWIDAADTTPTKEEAVTADKLPATMTYKSDNKPETALVYNAFWINEVDITFAKINPETEEAEIIKTETVTAGADFVAPEDPSIDGYRFIGWTTEWDDESNTLGGLTGLGINGKYPTTATTYYAVFSARAYTVNYYVLNADIENPTLADFKLVAQPSIEYKKVIPATPLGYEAPEGYALSVAYTDVVYADQIVFADANKFVAGTTMPASEYNLYFKIERAEFDAIFDANEGAWENGDTTKTVKAVYEEEIALPEEPVREGYVFAGWEPSVSIMDQEGKNFKAVWTPDEFNATYYVDGEAYDSFPLYFGEEMEAPDDPYKEGHEFLGWADAADSTTVVVLPATMPASDVNYYAVFKTLEYTIKFADTGDKAYEDITLPYGTAIGEVADPVKEGYTFTGWDVAIPETMPAEDMTITAKWQINKYTVTWIVDGTETPVEYEYGAPIVKADDPVKTGYTFGGWAPEFPEEGKLMPAEDLTYTAVFTANPYKATFYTIKGDETHDGAWANGSTSVEVETLFNETIVAPEEVPTRTGYTFAGWDPIVGVMDDINGKEYYAVWTPNANTEYKVEFYSMNTKGEYELTDTQELTGESDSVIKLVVSAPKNYTIDKALSTYDDDVTINPAGTTVVTVYYELPLYTITFDGNEGNVDGAAEVSKDYRYGAQVAVPAVERTGYTFIGWADAAENGNAVDVNLTAVTDVTYYAQWAINQYTITFNTDGGTEIPAKTQDYGTAVEAPANPTKLGHEFVAWDKVIPSTMPAEDMTITASWNPLAWDATFDAGEGKFADDSTKATVEDVTFGTAITAPTEEPTREGYEFNGWFDKDGNPVGSMDAEGKEFFADWKINQYTITFEDTGDTAIDPITQDYATAVTAPENPTKEGYTFKNWDVAIPETMPAGDMTITAVWEANQYTITFEDTGDTVIDPITQAYESAVKAPEDPEKTGYDFAGWEPEVPTEMPLNGATIKATWTPREDTVYQVVVNYTDAATGAKAVPYDFEGTTDNKIAIVDATPDPAADDTHYHVFAEEFAVQGYVLDTEADNDMTGVVAPDGTTVLNIYLVAVEYPVTYDANGGKFYDGSEEIVKNLPFNASTRDDNAPYEPTREGYTFAGWQGAPRVPVNGTTITASWTPNKYTIIWDTNGDWDFEATVEENIAADKVEYTQNDDYKNLVNKQPHIEKEGYTFAGWVDENGAAVTAPDNVPAEDLVIIATYTVNSYDIVWDDGTKTTTESKNYGSAIVEPAYEPTKEGYTFNGWATAEGKTPAEVATVPVDGVEFEAQWTKNKYKVNYFVIDPVTGEFGEAVATIEQVEYEAPISTVIPGYTAPEGYTLFDTVYTDTGFTAPLAGGAAMPAADVNLYYDLVANKYPAVFDANGGKWADGDTSKTVETKYNETIVAPEAPSLEGNEFAGWTPAVGTMDDVKGKTYVASWTPKTYTVTYKANGGVWGEDEAIETTQTFEVVYGAAIPAPEADPTRTGYKFNDWDAKAPATMPANDLTFTAQWEINKYTITFNTDGGSTVGDITQDYGTAVKAPADPTKTGYTFTGWVDAEGKPATVPATMPVDGAALKATWEVNKYDIIWNVDGVTTIIKDVPYGTLIEKKADPEKSGYTFNGWTGYTDGMTMPNNDVEFIADFDAKEYTVTFDADGGKWADGDTKKTVTGAYGSELKAPVAPDRTGYKFQTWSPSVPTTIPAENATYTAIWATDEEIGYTVNTYFMNTEGTYDGVKAVVTGGLATIDAYVKIPVDEAPVGFTYDANEANYIEGVVKGDGSTVFTVYYSRNSYTMTFNGNGGTINGNPDKIDTYYYGAQVVAPVAERTGYEFAGWDAAVPATMPAEDVTLNAQWTEATYTATFKAYPGAFEDGETTIVTDVLYGDEITVPQIEVEEGVYEDYIPVLEGYEFAGWAGYTDGMTIGAEDVTFTATWTEVYYDAVFYTDEKLDAASATTIPVQYTKEYNVPVDPIKEGYTFIGWNKVVDGKATNLPANLGDAGSKKVMETIGGEEYYATWEVNEVDLVYLAQGGNYDGKANLTYKVAYGTPKADMPYPANPVREGYTFNGYNPAELPATMPATRVNMAATWVINTYDATFDAGDGVFESTGETTSTTEDVPFEETLYAPDEEPKKAGYEFGGWTDGENIYYPGEEIGPMGADDITLKAEWTAVDSAYTVNHIYMDVNGTYDDAEVVPENLAAPTDSTVTAAQKDKDNFTFDAAASTVEGVVTADGALVLNLYYVREKNTVTTYDVDGSVIETIEAYYEAPISVAEPTKEGYTFAGWTDAEKNPVTAPETIPADDLAIYASWTLNSYGVIFDANEGAFKDSDTSKTVPTNYGAAIVAPAEDPIRVGYTFKGWFDALENGNSVATYTSMPALEEGETLTFYARWEANTNEYKILIYQMNPDGSMPEEPTSMVINNALVGETVRANVTVPAGFTLDEENSHLEDVVPAEGELVLKVVLVRAPHKFTAIVDKVAVVDGAEYYFDETVDQIETPTKDGWTFIGWSKTEGSTTVDAEYPARMPNNDVTIYGVWKVNSYNAVFNAGEGEFDSTGKATETVVVDYQQNITAPTEEPVREGYEFGGWKDSHGKVYEAGAVVGTMGKDGATFEAVWNRSNFTVTFYGYEALAQSPYKSVNPSVVLDTENYDFGAAITFPAEESFPVEAQIDGAYYTFVGWSKTADGEVLSNSELYTQTMPAEDTAYYAVYERVKVMLVPNDDAAYWTENNKTCTTVIDRTGENWYVYGLTDRMLVETSRDNKRLDTYIDVTGDGRYEAVEFKGKDGSVGTGTVINVYDNVTGEIVESFWIIIYGDINGDGAISNLDSTMAYSEDATDTNWSKVWGDYCHYMAEAADVNGDDIVNVTDAAQIEYYVIGTVEIDQATGYSSNI
ncbi:MAG: InlB B-repeat-containing protein [Clostridia bacterium]|nr:InlB B-repeat-containing protein [Clostridia bacterium]